MSIVYDQPKSPTSYEQNAVRGICKLRGHKSSSCAILDHCLTLSNEKRITLFLFVIPFKIPTLAMNFFVFGVYRPTREYFTYMETSPLPVNGYARHTWPLNSEGSLACHSFCDTRNPLIMIISEDP